jgi:DNA-binding Xre family transcriptional regulator
VTNATILLHLKRWSTLMIRFKIQELLAEKQFKEGKRVTLIEVSKATGINRMTISRMINNRGYSTVTDNLDKLCKFFNCKLEDIAEYVSESSDSDKE